MDWGLAGECKYCGAPVYVKFDTDKDPQTGFSCECRLYHARMLDQNIREREREYFMGRGNNNTRTDARIDDPRLQAEDVYSADS